MSTPIQGLSSMVVTVLSVQNNVALVRDQMTRQYQIRRDFQRAKGPWPEAGEQWIVDKSFGNEWTFAMIITPSLTPIARPPVVPVANIAARNALSAPVAGQMALRADTNAMDYFDGTIWRGSKTIHLPRVVPTLLGWTAVQNCAINSSYTVATLAIPDPGWPYLIESSAGMQVSFISANETGFSHYVALMVDTTTFPGVSATNLLGGAFVGGGQQFANAQVPWSRSQVVYTGAHTLNYIFKTGSLSTTAFGALNTHPSYHFDTQLLPV